VSATYKKSCPTCKGKGYHIVYVSEWTELLQRLTSFFKETCPNCESAWTGGHPNPEDIEFCVVCSDPKTGEIRGWVWRWCWFQRTFIVRKNYQKFISKEKS